jgi:ammonium transporter Rh
MIGTLFLFMYFPSFNAAIPSINGYLSYASHQHRAIINTLLALSTSVVSACLFSRITKKYLDMIIVINATLAGGASMGAAANLVNWPFCAMIVGFVAGMCATFGFSYCAPFFKKYLRLHDS